MPRGVYGGRGEVMSWGRLTPRFEEMSMVLCRGNQHFKAQTILWCRLKLRFLTPGRLAALM